MSFRVKASTIAFTTAAACLLLAPTAMASSRAPVQVTGKQLKSALLPTSDFLATYTAGGEHDSGGALQHGSVYKLPSVSCKVFWTSLGLADIAPGFGQTAYAGNIVSGGSASVPYQVLQQEVNQFASTKTASSFFSQLSAKFRSCPSLSESDTKGGTLRFTVHSRSTQRVGGHQALKIVEYSTDSNISGPPPEVSDLLWTIDGTDVYLLSSGLINVSSPQPSLSSLTLKLIARVGALR